MTLQVEKLEKGMAKLTVEVSAEQFEEAMKTSYNKNKNRFIIPGFRKGKASRMMIEKMYGASVFYEDAADASIESTYADALKESALEIVSRPEIGIEQLEKGKPFIYTATVAVKPIVTLGEYKGIEVEKVLSEVTDEDVETDLKRVQEQNARLLNVEDRAVLDGDHLIIDFDGYVDGVPFEGGKAENYSLVIGSHSFIDTFEEQLIGKNIGEEAEVSVTFPEEYHAVDLAGKPAVFHVVIKEIKVKELPLLDDEFAEEVSDFDTLAEYKEEIRARILENKQRQAATEHENRVIDKVVENAGMEIPDPMIQTQAERIFEDSARRMQSQGITLEQYLQYTGMTREQLVEQTRPQALKRIQTRLVLEAVVEAENIKTDDDAVEKELARMAESYGMELEQLKSRMGDSELAQIKEDLAVQEAVDFLVAEAKLI